MMIRIWTGDAAQLGMCDHCDVAEQGDAGRGRGQVVTAVSLHRGDTLVFLARFCQHHFLQFSDLVSDQVAALLYPIKHAH